MTQKQVREEAQTMCFHDAGWDVNPFKLLNYVNDLGFEANYHALVRGVSILVPFQMALEDRECSMWIRVYDYEQARAAVGYQEQSNG